VRKPERPQSFGIAEPETGQLSWERISKHGNAGALYRVIITVRMVIKS